MNPRSSSDTVESNSSQRILRRRPISPKTKQEALSEGFPQIVARVVASRGISISTAKAKFPPGHLPDPRLLPDMERACRRLRTALADQESIVVLADHDMDGSASAAVLLTALRDVFGHPPDRLHLVMSHRLTEGYGLTMGVAHRISNLQPKPTLVITADCGSSDRDRIAWLSREHQIDVLVTDHHGTGDEIPEAVAFVNPQRRTNRFPDRTVAGCMVAWLTMFSLANFGEPMRFGQSARLRALWQLLDYVAVGTIADCVDLGQSVLNRKLVRFGLRRIDSGARPCWRVAVSRWFGHPLHLGLCSARDVAFSLAPRIAATGRLDDAQPGVHFLLAEDEPSALVAAELLQQENNKRKTLQKHLLSEAIDHSLQMIHDQSPPILIVALPEGHAGVQGILASRLVEQFNRPAAVFSPRIAGSHQGEWSGSLRGGGYIDVRRLIVGLQQQLPKVVLGGGGHTAAGGMSVSNSIDFDLLRHEAYQLAHSVWLSDAQPIGQTILYSDGLLPLREINESTIRSLFTLEPYGRGFDAPQFECLAKVESIRPIGDGSHLRLMLNDGTASRKALWFNAIDADGQIAIAQGMRLHALYSPVLSYWNGNLSPELHITAAKRRE